MKAFWKFDQEFLDAKISIVVLEISRQKIIENLTETGYEKSSRESRNIRFIITKDGKNNGKHFVTDMPDSSQMVFTFRTFLLIENRNVRIFESGNVSGKPNSSS